MLMMTRRQVGKEEERAEDNKGSFGRWRACGMCGFIIVFGSYSVRDKCGCILLLASQPPRRASCGPVAVVNIPRNVIIINIYTGTLKFVKHS